MRTLAAFLAVATSFSGESLPVCYGDNVPVLERYIAVREGYFIEGSLPNLLNNPGALVFANQKHATPGLVGSDGSTFARFRSKKDGWRALDLEVRAKLASRKIQKSWNYVKK